jgi:hypothetical protein
MDPSEQISQFCQVTKADYQHMFIYSGKDDRKCPICVSSTIVFQMLQQLPAIQWLGYVPVLNSTTIWSMEAPYMCLQRVPQRCTAATLLTIPADNMTHWSC